MNPIEIPICQDRLKTGAKEHRGNALLLNGWDVTGRPASVQVWGRAVDYADMFDDSASVKNDVEFLYLVEKAAAAINAVPSLERRDAVLAADVLSAADAPKL